MSPDVPQSWTTLAHLLRPQGRKGEMLAELLTDFPERFTAHPAVFLAQPGFSGTITAARPAQVTAWWLPTGRNVGRIVIALAGIDSINQAEQLAGLEVIIATADRLPLEEGAQYIDDLVGCVVLDGTSEIGTLSSVDFSTGPDGQMLSDVAPLLTVVTTGGDEVLIPYVHQFVVSISIPERRIHMTLPEGLIGLNLPASRTQPPGSDR